MFKKFIPAWRDAYSTVISAMINVDNINFVFVVEDRHPVTHEISYSVKCDIIGSINYYLIRNIRNREAAIETMADIEKYINEFFLQMNAPHGCQ